jgi:hypothetical protein
MIDIFAQTELYTWHSHTSAYLMQLISCEL